MWIDDFSNRSLVTEATIKGPQRMSVASDRISSRCSSSQGASRRTSPGARENRTGIPMVRTSPSEGCSSRLKNPSARKCSSSSKSSGERTAQAGQEEIRSSGSSTPGLSDSVRPAGIRSGPRRAVDRECRDAASLPNQTAVLALLRTGGGHTIKRRLQNRGGEDRQIAEEGFDSRFEPEPQPAVEACFQKRGADLPPLR